MASDLVHRTRGRVYALYVIEVPWQYPVDAELPDATERGGQALDRVEQLLKSLKCDVVAEVLQTRDRGPAIVNEAMERDADLILMGMPYRRRHGVFSMGEAIPYILRSALCPVLVLREPVPSHVIHGRGAESPPVEAPL